MGSATEAAVMVAVPTFRVLMVPLSSTETVSESLLLQVTDLSAASQG